ncbi:MAG: phosphoadenylyl-sulfate reductase [Polyangiaceae bacterium]
MNAADHSMIEQENRRLELLSPEDRLRFAIEMWGRELLFTSSFGAGSAVLLHLWSEVGWGAPGERLPVVFLDTGFLFDETLAYRDVLAERLGLNVVTVKPTEERDDFLIRHGADIQQTNPDLCCATNKVAPLAPLLKTAKAWVSGLRRDQSPTRKNTPILLPTEDDADNHYVKVHPLATMTAGEVVDYMQRHALPEHPLRARRYLSIGCSPCTSPIEEGQDERSGRWAGRGKTECGLHSHALATTVSTTSGE